MTDLFDTKIGVNSAAANTDSLLCLFCGEHVKAEKRIVGWVTPTRTGILCTDCWERIKKFEIPKPKRQER